MGKPHSSTFGLRVSSTTMSNGTKKILRTVSELGRFIEKRQQGRRPGGSSYPAIHYRRHLCGRQRLESAGLARRRSRKRGTFGLTGGEGARTFENTHS